MAGKYIENYFYSRTFPKIVNRKIIFFFQEQYLPLCIVNNLSYVASVWNWLKRLNLATVRDNFEQPVNLVSDPVWQFFYILFSNDDCWQVNKINTFKHLANSIAETKIKNKKLPATKKSQINSFLLGYHWFVQNKTNTFLCYRFGDNCLYLLAQIPAECWNTLLKTKRWACFLPEKSDYFNW